MAKKNKIKCTINDTQIMTFTKKWVNRLLWCGVIWITWSYILASFGKDSIAESLSQTVAEVIIATTLGYLLKAFFETFCEKHNELKAKGLTKDLSDTSIYDEEETDSEESEQ